MPDVFNAPQMRIMLDLQSAMNRKVDPDWIEAAYPYLRAVVVEAAEAIEQTRSIAIIMESRSI